MELAGMFLPKVYKVSIVLKEIYSVSVQSQVKPRTVSINTQVFVVNVEPPGLWTIAVNIHVD